MKKRRIFSAEFKARVALKALTGAETMSELSAKHGVHPNMIAQWKRRVQEGLPGCSRARCPLVTSAVRLRSGIFTLRLVS